MKLTNNRYYFDYNSTSPLAGSVKKWISNGDLFMANPNSLHNSGRRSLKHIRETEDFLFNTYKIKGTHKILFHSGATEGINTFILSELKNSKDEAHLILFDTDHSSAFKIKHVAGDYGANLHIKSFVNGNGELLTDELIKFIKTLKGKVILNFTWVNNETGIIWPLKEALKIKNETSAYIHVDGTQSVCKIKDWNILLSEIDSYSFSGHKFGALSGIGFSFYKKDQKISYVVNGAKGILDSRPGTPNASGIYSIKLAMEETIKSFDYDRSKSAIDYLAGEFEKLIAGKGRVLSKESNLRNATTVCLYFDNKKGQDILNVLDMNGIEVGVGSACSSGVLSPNRVLMAYGIDEKNSNNSIRLSFAPSLNKKSAEEYFNIIKACLIKII